MTENFHLANTFVVNDITCPGQRIQWESMFREVLVVSTQMILSGHGPYMNMKPSFNTSHLLHLTDSFKAQHGNLAAIVERALQNRPQRNEGWHMRWRLEESKDAWFEKLQGATARRFPMHCLALVTEQEKKNREFKDLRGKDCFEKVLAVDLACLN